MEEDEIVSYGINVNNEFKLRLIEHINSELRRIIDEQIIESLYRLKRGYLTENVKSKKSYLL